MIPQRYHHGDHPGLIWERCNSMTVEELQRNRQSMDRLIGLPMLGEDNIRVLTRNAQTVDLVLRRKAKGGPDHG